MGLLSQHIAQLLREQGDNRDILGSTGVIYGGRLRSTPCHGLCPPQDPSDLPPAMEEDAELVELETAPEVGVTGITIARDPHGLYIAKAPRSLRVQQGDRLLGARVLFEGVPAEDVARVLESARGCRVSLCLRRRTRSPRVPNGEGHESKVARLTIPILTPSKKPPQAPSAVNAVPAGPVAVELAFPKLPKLVKSRSAAEPAPTAAPTAAEPPRAAPTTRLTVKEASGGKRAAMAEPSVKPAAAGAVAERPAGTGSRLPAVELAAPKMPVGLSLTGAAAPAAKEPALRLPQVEVAVPKLPLPAVTPELGATAKQPQTEPGEGDARRSGGSPVLKAKGTGFAAAEGEDGGARGGFASIRVPSIDIAVPSAAVELLPELAVPKAEPPPAAPARLSFPEVPSVEIVVPRVAVDLALAAEPEDAAAVPDVAARFAKGLRKLSLELEPAAPLPAVEIAAPARFGAEAKPKPSRFALPRFGLSLAKLRTGGDGTGYPPAPRAAAPGVTGPMAALDRALGTVGGAAVKLKVPKLSLAPFGAKDANAGAAASGGDDGRAAAPGSPRLRVPRVSIALAAPGGRRVPSLPKLPTGPELGGRVKLPKFGGSSPDIRTEGDPKAMRRGGSAESLSIGAVGRKMLPESPGTTRLEIKGRRAAGAGGAQAGTPRFSVPAVGFTAPEKQPEEPGGRKGPKPSGATALKIPVLELVPPGMDGTEEATAKETAPGRWSGVKLPKFGAGLSGGGRGGEGRARMGSAKKTGPVLVKPREKGGDSGVVGPSPHVNGEAEGKVRRRRWVPRVGFSPVGSPPEPLLTLPKVGKIHVPDVELSPRGPERSRGPQGSPGFALGDDGTPKFQLPKVALTPQPCGEW